MFPRSWDLGGLYGRILAAPQGGMGRKQLRGVGGGVREGLRKGMGTSGQLRKVLPGWVEGRSGGQLLGLKFKEETELS